MESAPEFIMCSYTFKLAHISVSGEAGTTRALQSDFILLWASKTSLFVRMYKSQVWPTWIFSHERRLKAEKEESLILFYWYYYQGHKLRIW